ncbi:MAG: ADP-ribosylglycohydrolase family protein [Clostridia bacterium]|nr:ADP-ribosylglycohydrolase family protein [Clostridia bacterium]
MYGAILGDIVGSVYEFHHIKTKEFPFLTPQNRFTDDTVMTVAVADAIVHADRDGVIRDVSAFQKQLCSSMHQWGRRFWTAGYGQKFMMWLFRRSEEPYHSYGNGAAMRVSPIAWYGDSLESVCTLAQASAAVTHDHPEGIKGAVCVAGAVFLARNGANKEEIRQFTSRYYDIAFTLADIRPTYRHDESCQGSVPQALQAFFEAEHFEDAIRNAISIGGDSDTIAAITGSVAEAFYGIPQYLTEQIPHYLDPSLARAANDFAQKYMHS